MTFVVAILLLSPPSGEAQTRPPGFEIYQPTKIEWAAVELQALHGKPSMTAESPIMITFHAQNDGVTVLCFIQHTADVQAAVLKIERESLVQAFDIYRRSRGWSWLRLQIDERPLNRSWPR